VADYDVRRAERAIAAHAADPRFVAAQVDASSSEAVASLCREHGITHVLNAIDPRFVMPVFDGAFAAGADYLDMAMSLSKPHSEAPHEKTGVKLGDEQFAVADDWVAAGSSEKPAESAGCPLGKTCRWTCRSCFSSRSIRCSGVTSRCCASAGITPIPRSAATAMVKRNRVAVMLPPI